MSLVSASASFPRHSPRWAQLTHPFCGKRIPGWEGNWAFDLTSRGVNQLAKLLTLLLRDRSQQVLNLRDAFPQNATATSEMPVIQE